MLTHLVVGGGLNKRGNALLSKSEIDDILKFGTADLFQDSVCAPFRPSSQVPLPNANLRFASEFVLLNNRPDPAAHRCWPDPCSLCPQEAEEESELERESGYRVPKQGKDIVYDDKAVANLLDRSQGGLEGKEEVANEYLSSFKVATFDTLDTVGDRMSEEGVVHLSLRRHWLTFASSLPRRRRSHPRLPPRRRLQRTRITGNGCC